jgi:hypothetical protein
MKVMSAIERCRTAALGGDVGRCENEACAHTVIAYNSCRNRHCSKCQGAQARDWMQAREAELLAVPYFQHRSKTGPVLLNCLGPKRESPSGGKAQRGPLSAQCKKTCVGSGAVLGGRDATQFVLAGAANWPYSRSQQSRSGPQQPQQIFGLSSKFSIFRARLEFPLLFYLPGSARVSPAGPAAGP